MTAVDAPAPDMALDAWAAPSLSDAEYRWRARRYRFRTVRRAAGFLSPYLIVWGVFLAIPAVWGIFLSFNQGGLIKGDPRVFVGFDNWTRTVSDSELRTAVKNTSIYVLIAIAVVFTLAIFLASLLNNYKRGSNFYKVALYFPLLAPPILGAIMWFFMINFDFGILNLLKRSVIGGEGIRFLGDNPHALLTIVAVEVWRGLGFWVLFYLAGLQSVPEELQAAARIDGAGKWRRFRRITVPTLRPLLLFALVIAVIFNFQLFDSVQVLTDGGPRLGTATVVWFIHKRLFKFQDTGLAYASSIGLLVVVLILTALSFWLLGKRRQREA